MCITYRRGEKELCNYLIYMSNRVDQLKTMNRKQAFDEINSWKQGKDNHDVRCEDFFRDHLLDLLPQSLDTKHGVNRKEL